jgi:hypothetical protein
MALLARIARLRPAGAWAPDRAIPLAADRLKRRGLIVVLSDFYDATETTFRALRGVARRGHDVALLQVVSDDEISFPYTADLELEDLEAKTRRIVDAVAAAPAYRARIADFLARCRTDAHRDGFDYALMPTSLAPERALRAYLLRRDATAPTSAGAAMRSAR